MNTGMRVILLCLFLLPAACVHYISPSCRAVCDQRVDTCHLTCRNSCPQCNAFANQRAAKYFTEFEREKIIEGKTVTRELKSYRDPLQCRKTTCNCQADYQICMQGCGGVIYKSLQVAPVC